MGYNGRLSLKILAKSVKVQNLPYPLLRGQPLNPCRLKTAYCRNQQTFVFIKKGKGKKGKVKIKLGGVLLLTTLIARVKNVKQSVYDLCSCPESN